MVDLRDEETKKEIIEHIKNIGEIIVKYFKCTLIDSAIIGVVNFIFMMITSMPHSILISFIMAFTNIVPNIGPVFGAIIGGIILMFYDTTQAIWFLVFTVILQAIDGLIIKPKLFGDSFGVSGVVMLIAMLIGGGVFGIVGMIFVVPVVAIAQYFYKKVYLPHKNIDKDNNSGQ